MKKIILVTSFVVVFAGNVYAAADKNNDTFQKKVDIMKEDQTDTTDIFAIPLDDSEVEDQQELEYIKKREQKFENK